MDARAGIDVRLAAQAPAVVPTGRKAWLLNVSARRLKTPGRGCFEGCRLVKNHVNSSQCVPTSLRRNGLLIHGELSEYMTKY